ncbi:MAG: rhodanese-like domain-containing protein [Caldimicrobium sp.]|nr:rhodanese-like domain-containing protein [Caldimicrobium sp.]
MPDLPGITKIDGAKAYELWKGKRAIFLDNRIKSHYDTEKIPGSRWFFTDSLIEKGASMANELDKTKTYVLYCNGVVCWRSPAAALILKHLGFNILWYKEGLPDWKKRGYPTE